MPVTLTPGDEPCRGPKGRKGAQALHPQSASFDDKLKQERELLRTVRTDESDCTWSPHPARRRPLETTMSHQQERFLSLASPEEDCGL